MVKSPSRAGAVFNLETRTVFYMGGGRLVKVPRAEACPKLEVVETLRMGVAESAVEEPKDRC